MGLIEIEPIWENAHLWLSMNQDINVKLFLELDNFFNFLLDGLNILLLGDPTNASN